MMSAFKILARNNFVNCLKKTLNQTVQGGTYVADGTFLTLPPAPCEQHPKSNTKFSLQNIHLPEEIVKYSSKENN